MMRPVPSVGRYGSAAWLHVERAHEVDVDERRNVSSVVLANIAGA